MAIKPTIFIQTNPQQRIGAAVAQYSIRKMSRHCDKFDIQTMDLQDYPILTDREGEFYLREGQKTPWRNGDLQSFTLLRFLPPKLMGYKGRAIVIDPDVFALSDIYDLFTKDMEGKSILCRKIPTKDGQSFYCATSVMLLDCEKLKHWEWEKHIEELFSLQRDYRAWMSLDLEPSESIGPLEDEWNHFDKLNEKTKLLHFTRRLTQPWKTGLPIDFTAKWPNLFEKKKPLDIIKTAWGWSKATWIYQINGRYRQNPDVQQEKFFFSLFRECLENGLFSEELIESEIRQNHLRPDILTLAYSLAN